MHFHIVTPSSCIDLEHIQLAQQHLQAQGHQVSLAAHVTAQHRYLAGTAAQRVHDLKQACLDPAIDVIWCGRGGVGASQLSPDIQDWILNKPIVGYSDSTVLLNEVARRGGHAIHGPVFQEIAVKNLSNEALSADALETIQLITQQTATVMHLDTANLAAQQSNNIQGQVLGGNLTVLCSLQGTANALNPQHDCILLLEDVGEAYYRLERCLTQLLQSIDYTKVKAVVMGDFYQCPQKIVPQSLTEIFAEHLDPLQIPLYQCPNFGHGLHNQPFWIGKTAQIQQSKLMYLE